MATTAIRNTAVIPANENRGESKVRSTYNAIVYALEPYFGPSGLEMLAPENRSKITAHERGVTDAYFNGVGPA